MNVPSAPRPRILKHPSASRASSLKVPRDDSAWTPPCAKLPILAQTRRYERGEQPGVDVLAGAAHRQRIDAQSGLADSDGHRLAFLPARPYTAVQLQVVAHHADPLQDIGTVADQGGAFDGRAELAVLDHVSFACREHEFARGDVDLAAAEIDGIQALLDGGDDLFRGALP